MSILRLNYDQQKNILDKIVLLLESPDMGTCELGFRLLRQQDIQIAHQQLPKMLRNTGFKMALCLKYGFFEALREVEKMYIYDEVFSELPREIGALGRLRLLELRRNQLEGLPKEIGFLKNLELLDLSDNRLTDLPPQIGSLRKLQSLKLKNNSLETVREELGDLKNLHYLDLSGNRLTAFPHTLLEALPKLQVLDLSDNQIRQVPGSLRHSKKVPKIYLEGNPLEEDSRKNLPASMLYKK